MTTITTSGTLPNEPVKRGSVAGVSRAQERSSAFDDALKKVDEKLYQADKEGSQTALMDSQKTLPSEENETPAETPLSVALAVPAGALDGGKQSVTFALTHTSPVVDIQQFDTVLEKLTQSEKTSGKWTFTLNNGGLISQVAVTQLAANNWAIQLATSNRSQQQLLTQNIEKLVRKLRVGGREVSIQTHRDRS